MSAAQNPESHRQRARLSLEGLSVGDAFGDRFFLSPETVESDIEQRIVPASPWPYTDDTVMGLSVVEILEEHGSIDQEALARRFATRYSEEPHRKYGGMAHRILTEIGRGADWRAVAAGVFDGMGSMGNGGAMRAGPIGAWFADDFAQAAEQARRAAEVTHAHLEGQAGAMAVAVAAAWASQGRGQGRGLLETTIDHLPDSETRASIAKALSLPRDFSVRSAASVLGNGERLTSQDTVPFALWCAARSIDHFEEALWITVSALGDRDTTCAIVGSIVALAVGIDGIPAAWRAAREPLPLR
jgi:ADP-ribosylglycohydrolase